MMYVGWVSISAKVSIFIRHYTIHDNEVHKIHAHSQDTILICTARIGQFLILDLSEVV